VVKVKEKVEKEVEKAISLGRRNSGEFLRARVVTPMDIRSATLADEITLESVGGETTKTKAKIVVVGVARITAT
jgi:hypothetical protein